MWERPQHPAEIVPMPEIRCGSCGGQSRGVLHTPSPHWPIYKRPQSTPASGATAQRLWADDAEGRMQYTPTSPTAVPLSTCLRIPNAPTSY